MDKNFTISGRTSGCLTILLMLSLQGMASPLDEERMEQKCKKEEGFEVCRIGFYHYEFRCLTKPLTGSVLDDNGDVLGYRNGELIRTFKKLKRREVYPQIRMWIMGLQADCPAPKASHIPPGTPTPKPDLSAPRFPAPPDPGSQSPPQSPRNDF